MNKIKKLFGYAILATLVTVGSLDAQVSRSACPPHESPSAGLMGGLFGAGATLAYTMAYRQDLGKGKVRIVRDAAKPVLTLAGFAIGTRLVTSIIDQNNAKVDNCLAWEAYHAAQAEDQRRAAELRRQGEERTRRHLAWMAAYRAETDSLAALYGVPKEAYRR